MKLNKREIGVILIAIGTSVIANAVPGGPSIMTWPPPLDWTRVLIGGTIVFIGWRML